MDRKVVFYTGLFSLIVGVVLVSSVLAHGIGFSLNQVLDTQEQGNAVIIESYLVDEGYDLEEQRPLDELMSIYDQTPPDVAQLFDEESFNFEILSGSGSNGLICTHIKKGIFWDSTPYDQCANTCADLATCNTCCETTDFDEDEQRWCKRHCRKAYTGKSGALEPIDLGVGKESRDG